MRTRFAPSPSGRLHLGHLYAAACARDLARRLHGECLLRIEDIDSTRCHEHWTEGIIEDLNWSGLRFSSQVLIQSERRHLYDNAVSQLREQGVLYPCFCTRKEIMLEQEQLQSAPHGVPFNHYPGTCRTLSERERLERMESGRGFSWRLHAEQAGEITGDLTFTDIIRGEYSFHPRELDDVILSRKDCSTSYHIAVVVDDADQGITHVSRGRDLLDSTPVHRTLQALLKLPIPVWAHHDLVLDPQGNRLAKRANSLSIKELRDSGLSPAEVWHILKSMELG